MVEYTDIVFTDKEGHEERLQIVDGKVYNHVTNKIAVIMSSGYNGWEGPRYFPKIVCQMV